VIEREWKSPSSIDIKAKKDKETKRVWRGRVVNDRGASELAHTGADKETGWNRNWRTTHNLAVNIGKINAHEERERQAAQTQNRDGERKITKDIITSQEDNKGGKGMS